MPGPGAYESPEKASKGFTIGQKREEKIPMTPGVGSYEARNDLTVSKEASVKISQAKREDLWKQELKTAETPGPGAVDPYEPARDTGFVFSKEGRFPDSKETIPGPGTYELLDD